MTLALVTGAAVRVGRAIAEHLASIGYDLVLHANSSRSSLPEVARCVSSYGRRSFSVAADLTQDSTPELLARVVDEAGGALDLLVNSAGIYERTPIEEADSDAFRRHMQVNVEAPFFLIKRLLPQLRAAACASVINITDASVGRPYGGFAPYLASKAALTMLTRALAVELGPRIRVNAVAPGALSFPANFDQAKRRRILASVPLGHEGSPADVARAVAFLANDAPYVTGHVLTVDGGLVML